MLACAFLLLIAGLFAFSLALGLLLLPAGFFLLGALAQGFALLFAACFFQLLLAAFLLGAFLLLALALGLRLCFAACFFLLELAAAILLGLPALCLVVLFPRFWQGCGIHGCGSLLLAFFLQRILAAKFGLFPDEGHRPFFGFAGGFVILRAGVGRIPRKSGLLPAPVDRSGGWLGCGAASVPWICDGVRLGFPPGWGGVRSGWMGTA